MRHVTGRFADLDAARAAILELERHGFDAGRVTLRDEPAIVDPVDQRRVDLRESGAWIRRAALGGVIGSILGAAILTAIAILVIDDIGTGVILASIVGGIAFGGAAGFYYGVVSKLPVNEQAISTGAPAAGRLVLVEVRAEDEHGSEQAAAVLRDLADDVSVA